MNITESLLQYIWKTKTLLKQSLQTTNGELIKILQPGILNTNQGPDFLMAKIIIDEVEWVGNIEIHVKSSQWIAHRHSDDEAYNNVILHVVLENDAEIHRNIPCLELRDLIDQHLLTQYQLLTESITQIPCQNMISNVPQIIVFSQFDQMMAQRLDSKVSKLSKELQELQHNWEALFYLKLASYLVTPVNTDAMNELTRKVPYSLLLKLSQNLTELESVLFGTAGFLQESDEDYAKDLMKQFHYQKNKWGLVEMKVVQWKFLRMRPSHFPTLRIAQIAAFYAHHRQAFQKIIECEKVTQVFALFHIESSEYWRTHFSFGSAMHKAQKTSIGKSTFDILMINVIAPFLYLYAEIQHDEAYRVKSDIWLKEIKAESNRYTKIWNNVGIQANNAGESQAMIEQFTKLCSLNKCLECKIGDKVLKLNL
ncbi:MAG: DUF2851 family protein [Saprospiraceae bacterium]